MNEKKYSGIEEIMGEWKKEVEKLEPLKNRKNSLNNSLNSERLAIKAKYEKIIEEYMKESTEKEELLELMKKIHPDRFVAKNGDLKKVE